MCREHRDAVEGGGRVSPVLGTAVPAGTSQTWESGSHGCFGACPGGPGPWWLDPPGRRLSWGRGSCQGGGRRQPWRRCGVEAVLRGSACCSGGGEARWVTGALGDSCLVPIELGPCWCTLPPGPSSAGQRSQRCPPAVSSERHRQVHRALKGVVVAGIAMPAPCGSRGGAGAALVSQRAHVPSCSVDCPVAGLALPGLWFLEKS